MEKKLIIPISILAVALGGMITLKILGRPVKVKKNTGLSFILDKDIKEILYYASLAPSSHNSQNWYVIISPDKHEIKVFLDKRRTLSVIDPHLREAYICIGAFLENLLEAFAAYGYHVSLTPEDRENDMLCAKAFYEKTSSSLTEKHSTGIFGKHTTDVFPQRHGDKSAFKTKAISANVLNPLLDKHGDYVRYVPANSKDGQYISGITLAAIIKQMQNKNIRDELSQWLRFSDTETKTQKDGLPAELLGVSGIMKSLYYLMMNRELSKGNIFARTGIIKAKTQLEGCAGFFLVTGPHGKKGWIEAGMHMEAFWLDATRCDIAINPMSAALEHPAYSAEISSRFGQGFPVQMILRAGILDNYGKNSGIRRDLKNFVFTP